MFCRKTRLFSLALEKKKHRILKGHDNDIFSLDLLPDHCNDGTCLDPHTSTVKSQKLFMKVKVRASTFDILPIPLFPLQFCRCRYVQISLVAVDYTLFGLTLSSKSLKPFSTAGSQAYNNVSIFISVVLLIVFRIKNI